ncbi:MAG: phosphoserine phosphatase SerB [Candidatus Micrarchaeia archaeon]
MLAVFDVERVLIDGEFLPEVARYVGKEKEVEEITFKGLRGEIKWEDGLKERVEKLKGLERKYFEEVAYSLPLMPNAKEAVKELKSMGLTVIAITGGFQILAQRVKDQLHLDYVFSNQLLFDKENRLSGMLMQVTSDKAKVIKENFKEASRKDCVSIVDGANDLTLFDISSLRIAFNAQEIVKKKADIIIDDKDLMLVVEKIRNFCNKIG